MEAMNSPPKRHPARRPDAARNGHPANASVEDVKGCVHGLKPLMRIEAEQPITHHQGVLDKPRPQIGDVLIHGLWLLGGGLGWHQAEMTRKLADLGVTGVALAVLDAKHCVVGDTDFSGKAPKVAGALFKLGNNAREDVWMAHARHIEANLPCLSRRFCLFLTAHRGNT